uniref:ULP_PROTEASE domain-containing protein n=1 Tax=Strongyloides venezuelensis TaxID=75913 RepID=A0A0K0G1Y3_STRVS
MLNKKFVLNNYIHTRNNAMGYLIECIDRMAYFDFAYKEELNFDDSFDKMSSKSKYEKVVGIYKRTPDRSKGFILGAKYILHFAKTFENLNIADFRAMILKSRAQYRAIPSKSEEDKKFLLFLYIELINHSKVMTICDFFKQIWSTDELSDYVPYFIYFGRIFAEECDYVNLKVLVDNAKVGLQGTFSGVKELNDFEDLVLKNAHLIPHKVDPPSRNTIFMFKSYEDASYEEVLISRFKKMAVPPIVVTVSNYCHSAEKNIKEEGSPLKCVSNVVTEENKENDSVMEFVDEIEGYTSVNTTLKSSSPLKDDYKKKVGDASNLEAVSFCTNISNKLASAFSETLPPQEVSVNNTTVLDETIPPPNFVTPARVSLKRDRKELMLMEEKLSQEKEFSVFEDDNMTRTRVYVDQTGDDDVLDEDLVRSPLRKKKIGCLKSQIKPSYNISVVVEEDDVVMEDLPHQPAEIVVNKAQENSPVVCKEATTSFNLEKTTGRDKVDVSNVVNIDDRSNKGGVNSFEFRESYTIPTRAEEEVPSTVPQKNAPRPSLMMASTPCRGTEPLPMEECSFYHDLSVIKGDDDDKTITKVLGDESKCSLLSDNDGTLQNISAESGLNILSSSKSKDTKGLLHANTERFPLDYSDSQVCESYGSVDLFEAIGDADTPNSRVFNEDANEGEEDFLFSSTVDKTVINNERSLDDTIQPFDDGDMEAGDLGSQINIAMEDVDVSVKKIEEGCTSNVSLMDGTIIHHHELNKSNRNTTNEVGFCKEGSVVNENKETPTVEQVLNVSRDKGHVKEDISEPIDKDNKCSSPKDFNVQSLPQTSGNTSLSSSRLANELGANKVTTEQFMLESCNSHLNDSCGSVDIFQVIGEGDKTAPETSKIDVFRDNEAHSQRNELFLESSAFDKTIITNEHEVDKILPALSDNIEVRNLEKNEEIHVNDANVMGDLNVNRQSEGECTLDVSKSNSTVKYSELDRSDFTSKDGMDVCKEESNVAEHRETSKNRSILDVSQNKVLNEESLSKQLANSNPKNETFSNMSGTHILSPQKADSPIESTKVSDVKFILESSSSKINESCGSADIFQAIDDEERDASKIIDDDIYKDDGVHSQRGGNVLDSNNADKTTVTNESGISNTLPAISEDMEVCNIETNKKVHVDNISHMEDVNIYTEQFEGECASKASNLDTAIECAGQAKSNFMSGNEMEVCEGENFASEQQCSPKVESIFNVSENKGHHEDHYFGNLGGDVNRSSPIDNKATTGSFLDGSRNCLLSSQKSDIAVESTEVIIGNSLFVSSPSPVNESNVNVNRSQIHEVQNMSTEGIAREGITESNGISSNSVIDFGVIEEESLDDKDVVMEDINVLAKNSAGECTLEVSKLDGLVESSMLNRSIAKPTDEMEVCSEGDSNNRKQETSEVKSLFDVSNTEGHDGDLFSSSPIQDRNNSLFMNGDLEGQDLSNKSELHLLSSPKSSGTVEATNISTQNILFNNSIHHASESCANTSLLQSSGIQNNSGATNTDSDAPENNGVYCQENESVLKSSYSNKTASFVEDRNKVGDMGVTTEESQMNTDIEMEDGNVSYRKSEEVFTSETPQLHSIMCSSQLYDERSKSANENVSCEQRETSNPRSLFDSSISKGDDNELFSKDLGEDSFAEGKSFAIQVSSQCTEVQLLSSPRSGVILESSEVSTMNILFGSSTPGVNESLNQVNQEVIDGNTTECSVISLQRNENILDTSRRDKTISDNGHVLNKTIPTASENIEFFDLKTDKEGSHSDTDINNADISIKKIEEDVASEIRSISESLTTGDYSKLNRSIIKPEDEAEIHKEETFSIGQRDTSNAGSIFNISCNKENDESKPPEDGSSNIKYLLDKYGINLLSSPRSDNAMESPKVQNMSSLFDLSISHASDGSGNVNFSQTNENQMATNLFDGNISDSSGIFSQRAGAVLSSPPLNNITVDDKRSGSTEAVLTVDGSKDYADFEINKEEHSTRRDILSDFTNRSTLNVSKPVDGMDIGKEGNTSQETQGTPKF